MNSPVVSVVMNCLNGASYLRDALDSVFAQTFTDWEIIFWDNASTDYSAKIARSYDDKKLRYFRSPTTHGLAKVRMLALTECRGEFVAFLDVDDAWIPEKLEKQLPLFHDPEVGLVYSNSLHFVDGTSYAYPAFETICKPVRGHIFRHLLSSQGITFSTVVLRRECLRKIGGFSESLHLAIDLDLFLRISYSWKADYIADPLIRYRIHPDSWSVRRPDLMYEDTKTILERLRTYIPGIETSYPDEMARFKRQMRMLEANSLWFSGNKHEARKIFLSAAAYLGAWKAWVFYFLTYAMDFDTCQGAKHKLKCLKLWFHSNRLGPSA